MAALDPRIEVIRSQYGLDKADFWELPQKKGTWLVKHAALELVAAKAGIRFDMPQIVEANSVEGVTALVARGEMGDHFEWSIGEASPKNSKNSYPWAMAEKRAKDRVILKLIGIHGLVYSEDEIDESRPPAAGAREVEDTPAPKTLVKDQRVLDGELRKEIEACATLGELDVLWHSAMFQTELKKLKPEWQALMQEKAREQKEHLIEASQRNGGYVDPRQQFDAMEGRQ